MSSAPSKTTGLSFSIGLSCFFALVFLGGYLGVFLLAHWMLSSTINAKEREIVSERLADYRAWYESLQREELLRRFRSQSEATGDLIFVRLVRPGRGSELLFSNPRDQAGPDLEALDRLPEQGRAVVASLISRNPRTYWTVASVTLRSGAVLQAGRVSNSSFAVLDRFRRAFLWSALPFTLVAFLGGVFLSYRAVKPVRDLGQTVHEILRTGKLDKRVPVPKQPGSLGEMAALFNELLGRNERLIVAMRESLDNAAHDLRTPMTRLRAVAEDALAHAADPQRAREALGDCMEESERLLSMLDTLLEVAEAEAGAMVLHLDEVDLVTSIRQVADLYELVAEDRGIELTLNLPERMPLRADGNRMQQVIANLVDNALKYGEAGGTVVVSATQDQESAIVTVQDDGVGIPPADLPRIWDRLYRGDRSRSRRGLGLGLSFVRAIVEAHGGQAKVESAEGAGATFEVRIPLKLVVDPE